MHQIFAARAKSQMFARELASGTCVGICPTSPFLSNSAASSSTQQRLRHRVRKGRATHCRRAQVARPRSRTSRRDSLSGDGVTRSCGGEFVGGAEPSRCSQGPCEYSQRDPHCARAAWATSSPRTWTRTSTTRRCTTRSRSSEHRQREGRGEHRRAARVILVILTFDASASSAPAAAAGRSCAEG